MQRNKAAIDVDRVALCPPAGHMTSSYWAAKQGSRPVTRTEIHREARDMPLLNMAASASSQPVRSLPGFWSCAEGKRKPTTGSMRLTQIV
jgi:hypothetical protein